MSPRRLVVAGSAVFLVLGNAGVALAMSLPKGGASVDDNKQRICHATNSDGNQYVNNEPAKSGDLNGHAGHTGPLWGPDLKDSHISWGDIIPPFDYLDGETVKHFDGLNWPAGRATWLTWEDGCDFVAPALSLSVVKTNDADADDEFSDEETATGPGSDVTFQVVVTNNGDAPVVIDSVVDKVGAAVITFDCADAEDASLVGQTLAVGDSVTCTATVADYSPAAGGTTTNTVTVTGHQGGDCVLDDSPQPSLRRVAGPMSVKVDPEPCALQEDPGNTVTDSDTSVVDTAPEPTPTETVSPTPEPTETVSPTPEPTESVSPSPTQSTGGGGTIDPGESPSPTTSPAPFTGGGGVVTLPFTGFPVAVLSATAAGLLALGAWLLLVGRRRTSS